MLDGFTAGTSEGGLNSWRCRRRRCRWRREPARNKRGAERTGRLAWQTGRNNDEWIDTLACTCAPSFQCSPERTRRGTEKETAVKNSSRAEQTRADYVRSTFLSTRATIAGPLGGQHRASPGPWSGEVGTYRSSRPSHLPRPPSPPKKPRTLEEPGRFVIVFPRRVVLPKLDCFSS